MLTNANSSLLCAIITLVAMSMLSAREPQTSPPTTTQKKAVRARDLGLPFDGNPGKFNTITDVAGVEVGYTTLISGEGKLIVGKGPVRTGVTAIIPRGKNSLNDPVYAGVSVLNGNGEMTGTAWIDESGFLEGPVVLTNTHSVGVARDAVMAWRVAHGGAIEEGSIGGGTGMICYEFKGGVGTASRVVAGIGDPGHSYTVAALVQANCGRRPQLTIAGVPVGKEIPENAVYEKEAGSCVIVIASDAPLLPHQLKRLARRAALGLARTGTISGNGSGDLFLAFSTANAGAANPKQPTHSVETVPNDRLDPLFAAVVQSTEEAILNALVDNRSMTGRDNHHVDALPHDRLRELLKKYNRLNSSAQSPAIER